MFSLVALWDGDNTVQTQPVSAHWVRHLFSPLLISWRKKNPFLTSDLKLAAASAVSQTLSHWGWMMGAMMNVVPSSLRSALLQLEEKKTRHLFPRWLVIWNSHMSALTFRHFHHRDTTKWMIHPSDLMTYVSNLFPTLRRIKQISTKTILFNARNHLNNCKSYGLHRIIKRSIKGNFI